MITWYGNEMDTDILENGISHFKKWTMLGGRPKFVVREPKEIVSTKNEDDHVGDFFCSNI